MHSRLPKVLHTLAGRPLLAYVLGTAAQLQPGSVCVVYGHGGEQVLEAFPDSKHVTWVLQEQQLGTGHALMQALPHLKKDQPTLVLFGDVPLTGIATLQRLREAAGSGMAVLTVDLDRSEERRVGKECRSRW